MDFFIKFLSLTLTFTAKFCKKNYFSMFAMAFEYFMRKRAENHPPIGPTAPPEVIKAVPIWYFFSPELLHAVGLISVSASLTLIGGLYFYNTILFVYPSIITDIHKYLGFKTSNSNVEAHIKQLLIEINRITIENDTLNRYLAGREAVQQQVIDQISAKFRIIRDVIRGIDARNIESILDLRRLIAALENNIEAFKRRFDGNDGPPGPGDINPQAEDVGAQQNVEADINAEFNNIDNFAVNPVVEILPDGARIPIDRLANIDGFNIQLPNMNLHGVQPLMNNVLARAQGIVDAAANQQMPIAPDPNVVLSLYQQAQKVVVFLNDPSGSMIGYFVGEGSTINYLGCYIYATLPYASSTVFGASLVVVGTQVAPKFFSNFIKSKTASELVLEVMRRMTVGN